MPQPKSDPSPATPSDRSPVAERKEKKWKPIGPKGPKHVFSGRDDWKHPLHLVAPCKPDRYRFVQHESDITDVYKLLCEQGPMTRCQIEEHYAGKWLSNGALATTLCDLVERGLVEACRWAGGPNGEVMLWHPVRNRA